MIEQWLCLYESRKDDELRCLCVHRNMSVFFPPHPTAPHSEQWWKCSDYFQNERWWGCASEWHFAHWVRKRVRVRKWVKFRVRKWGSGHNRVPIIQVNSTIYKIIYLERPKNPFAETPDQLQNLTPLVGGFLDIIFALPSIMAWRSKPRWQIFPRRLETPKRVTFSALSKPLGSGQNIFGKCKYWKFTDGTCTCYECCYEHYILWTLIWFIGTCGFVWSTPVSENRHWIIHILRRRRPCSCTLWRLGGWPRGREFRLRWKKWWENGGRKDYSWNINGRFMEHSWNISGLWMESWYKHWRCAASDFRWIWR